MKKKQSEREWKQFANRTGFETWKYRDALQCDRCHNVIWQSAGKHVDYGAEYKLYRTIVEVKQGSGKYGAWAFANPEKGVRDSQREEMDEWLENKGSMPYVFFVVGSGRAPNGRGAFLVPWAPWKHYEKLMLDAGQKSIRFEGGRLKYKANDTFSDFALVWKASEAGSGWKLPWGHPFYEFMSIGEKVYEFVNNIFVGNFSNEIAKVGA